MQPRRAARRQITCQQRHQRQEAGGYGEDCRVAGLDLVQQARQHPPRGQSARDANGEAHHHEAHALQDDLPQHAAAANPADLLAWTDGRALIVTGSAFAPVTRKGVTYVIGQANNAMLYPGLALGAIVSRASRISAGMFAAAASAVSSLVTVRQPGASLLPHIDDLRSVSVTV